MVGDNVLLSPMNKRSAWLDACAPVQVTLGPQKSHAYITISRVRAHLCEYLLPPGFARMSPYRRTSCSARGAARFPNRFPDPKRFPGPPFTLHPTASLARARVHFAPARVDCMGGMFTKTYTDLPGIDSHSLAIFGAVR